MEYRTSHVTQALIHLEHLAHNMRVLQELVGPRPLWPVLKANAYGHGAAIVGRHLVHLGYTHLCVAHVAEAIALELLVHGRRCRQVGQICMDQCVLDVTALRGQVHIGDEAVIIGRQSYEEVTADALAAQLGTINYEIVTHIAQRVPRIAVGHDL